MRDADPLVIDAKVAAKQLGICTRLLWQLRDAGEIQYVRIGRRVLYRPEHLEEYVQRQTRGTEKPNED